MPAVYVCDCSLDRAASPSPLTHASIPLAPAVATQPPLPAISALPQLRHELGEARKHVL